MSSVGDPAALRLKDEAVLWRRVGDEVVVYGIERSEYLATNPAGTLLWPLLAQGATLAGLADALRERWELSAEQAHADAAAFVSDLRAQGMIEA
jgi:hypothetical protein